MTCESGKKPTTSSSRPSGSARPEIWLLALGIVLLALAPLSAAAEEMDPAAYRSTLDETRRALEQAPDGPSDAQTAAASAQAERLRGVGEVRQGDVLVVPHNAPLLAALESDPPDLPRALAALEAIGRALDDPPRPADAEAAQALAREILASPEFQTEVGPLQSLVELPLLYVRRMFLEGLAAVGELLLAQGRLGLYVAGGLAVGLIAAGAWFVWRSLGGRVMADAPQASTGVGGRRPSSRSLWLEGQQLAAQGQARSAARAFFLSAALHLDELGVLRFDPSLTNREHLTRLTRPELRSVLEPLVASYDHLWYGHAVCGADEVAHVQRLALQVRSVSA